MKEKMKDYKWQSLSLNHGCLVFNMGAEELVLVPLNLLLQIEGPWMKEYMLELYDAIRNDTEVKEFCGVVRFYPSGRTIGAPVIKQLLDVVMENIEDSNAH